MAKGKEQGLTKKDLEVALKKLRSDLDKRFDEIDGRFADHDMKLINLGFDSKENKQQHREMMEKLDRLYDILVALDKRVRYQDDLPERMVQAEHDIHDLKREVRGLKVKS